MVQKRQFGNIWVSSVVALAAVSLPAWAQYSNGSNAIPTAPVSPVWKAPAPAPVNPPENITLEGTNSAPSPAPTFTPTFTPVPTPEPSRVMAPSPVPVPVPVSVPAPIRRESSEDWKGADLSGDYDVGAMTGLGVVNSSAGYYLGATGAIKILPSGFIPDITNPVFLETDLGTVFALSSGVFAYSLHLRWDFQKDSQWTLFAVGGFGGDVTGSNIQGSIYPRFGAGAFYRINEQLNIRGEISHEQITVGVNFTFL